MAEAYRSSHYTLGQVGDEFGASCVTVSRAVKDYECQTKGPLCFVTRTLCVTTIRFKDPDPFSSLANSRQP